MDFTLTDEQQLIADTASALLAKVCPTSLLRAAMDDPAAVDPLWQQLGDWVQLGDPSASLTDLCLFLDQAGLVALPGPFLPTAAFALPALRLAGLHEHADRVAAGKATATVAGLDRFVMEAAAADLLVVIDGDQVSVHESPTDPTEVPTLDGTRRLHDVAVPATDPFATGSLPSDSCFVERCWVALSAEMVGTSRRLLDMAVEHATERHQFDRPIGSFQAVQHQLADLALDVERATAAVYEAAMTIDAAAAGSGRAADEVRRVAHVAKAAAGAAATRAAKQSIQTHGGIGYTWDHDLHLFIRRAIASGHVLGTRGWHHERLGELLVSSGR